MYFVKLKVKYAGTGLYSTVIVKSNNSTQAEAANYAEAIAAAWEGIASAEAIEVSTREIHLQKYIIVVRMFYTTKAPREMKIHITEENEEKAAALLDSILQTWQNWKEYEIITIIPQIKKRWK